MIAKSPLNSSKIICKKILQIGGGTSSLNTNESENKLEDLKIPYGYVWLVGENRKESKDSYTYGPVPYGLIQSR